MGCEPAWVRDLTPGRGWDVLLSPLPLRCDCWQARSALTFCASSFSSRKADVFLLCPSRPSPRSAQVLHPCREWGIPPFPPPTSSPFPGAGSGLCTVRRSSTRGRAAGHGPRAPAPCCPPAPGHRGTTCLKTHTHPHPRSVPDTRGSAWPDPVLVTSHHPLQVQWVLPAGLLGV